MDQDAQSERRPDAAGARAPSQQRNFLLLVSMFAGVQIVIVGLAIGSLALSNLIRAYSTGEGLYSKSQKQAVYALERYADTGDPRYYDVYLEKIRVPLGDRQARIALESAPPDRASAREGFLAGLNDPADVPGMITVFLLFHETPLFSAPIALWREADGLILDMVRHAESLHAALRSESPDPARVRGELARIYALDEEITRLQNLFSRQLGQIARAINLAAALVLVVASLLLSAGSIVFGARLQRRSMAAEAALAQREFRLRALMNSTADGILSIDADGRIESVNRAAARVLGRPPDDLRGRPLSELVADESRAEFEAAVEAALGTDSRAAAGRALIFDGRRGDGGEFPMEAAFTTFEGVAGQRLIMTLRDITERLETEARLFQAQKMEAVGQLTGGVAHDFNNLLTVITGNLELLRDELGDSNRPADILQPIDAALSAAERGARVTSHLLAFSRRQPLASTPVHVDELIEGMRGLLSQTASGAIELGYRLEALGWHAMIDPAQLEAALLNLVLNARHATGDGGQIVISSRQYIVDSRTADDLELEHGEYVQVAVSDTGVGIPAENIDRVFDPFFTTRDVGSGSGLGLSMVQGFVKQSGGQVRLTSMPGKGTTVELFLPRALPGEAAATASARQTVERGKARLLVVEDNPSLRDIAVRMLKLAGYDVEGVGDGPAALDRMQRGPAPELVLSDVVLPEGMDGFSFARRVREAHPGVQVLLMSGFPRDSLQDPAAKDYRLLPKPFTREQLLQAVTEVLAERSGA